VYALIEIHRCIVMPKNWNLASPGNRWDKGRLAKGVIHELDLE